MKVKTAEQAATALFKIRSLQRTIEQLESVLKDKHPLVEAQLFFKMDNSTGEITINCNTIDQESYLNNTLLQLRNELAAAESALENLEEPEPMQLNEKA